MTAPPATVYVASPVRCCRSIIPAGAVIRLYHHPTPNRVWVLVEAMPPDTAGPPTEDPGAACASIASFDPAGTLRLVGTLHKLKASTFRRITRPPPEH